MNHELVTVIFNTYEWIVCQRCLSYKNSDGSPTYGGSSYRLSDDKCSGYRPGDGLDPAFTLLVRGPYDVVPMKARLIYRG